MELGAYSQLNGVFYCLVYFIWLKPHYKQIFATKGNYSDGFKDYEQKNAVLKEKSDSLQQLEGQSNQAKISDLPSETERKNSMGFASNDFDKKSVTSVKSAQSAKSVNSNDNLRELCVACEKTVYPAEKIVANNKVFGK